MSTDYKKIKLLTRTAKEKAEIILEKEFIAEARLLSPYEFGTLSASIKGRKTRKGRAIFTPMPYAAKAEFIYKNSQGGEGYLRPAGEYIKKNFKSLLKGKI